MLQAIQDQIKQLGIVIIVPTYNNEKTLKRVLDGILEYTTDVIVVNDGSTDTTASILSGYEGLAVIGFPSNRGKGMALREGLRRAKERGFNYAITIDSDGQHYPSDIPVFVHAIATCQESALWIGSRNMGQDSVPKKSSFGNRFSNFWFWVETGIKLTDTQSGFRAYPLQSIPEKYYTRKFEFEIEIIVRTAWEGVAVKNVPVRVLYDPNERVSHFRPFKDFTRISILNTILVFLTFVYIVPRNFLRSFKKKSWRDFVKQNILGSDDSPQKMAVSIGLGVCMGIVPVWGFQTALVITLAVFFRLNKVLAFTFSHVSLPPFIPLVIYASLWVGGRFLPHAGRQDFLSLEGIGFSSISDHLMQYILGSVILALSMGISVGILSYILIRIMKNKTATAE